MVTFRGGSMRNYRPQLWFLFVFLWKFPLMVLSQSCVDKDTLNCPLWSYEYTCKQQYSFIPQSQKLEDYCPWSCQNCPKPQNVIHVAPSGGINTQQCGSKKSPCDTLEFAISHRAGDGDKVVAMEGVHQGSGSDSKGILLSKPLNVIGKGTAVLDCGGNGRGFFISGGHSTLQHITVTMWGSYLID